MKNQKELVAKIKAESGMFSFIPEVLIEYLDFDHAIPFLNDEWRDKRGEWEVKSQDREAIIADMRSYMEFAWGKCLDHRGISAGRSVEKMKAWLWLLGDVDAYTFANDGTNYPNYGAPILMHISDKYGFPIPDDEDARLMAQGKHCTADYSCGCGK